MIVLCYDKLANLLSLLSVSIIIANISKATIKTTILHVYMQLIFIVSIKFTSQDVLASLKG